MRLRQTGLAVAVAATCLSSVAFAGEDDSRSWCGCFHCKEAPRGIVVPSIPALMLAQPAVPVTPGFQNEALRKSIAERQRDLLRDELKEALQSYVEEQRQAAEAKDDSSPDEDAAAEPSDDEADLEAILEAIEVLKRKARKLQKSKR